MAPRRPQAADDGALAAIPRTARPDWAAQRLGLVLLLLFVLAALTGAFGGGPLSHARVEAGGVRLEYDRIVRRLAPGTLRLDMADSAPRSVRLRLPRQFLETSDIDRIEPHPQQAVGGRDGITYTLELDAGGSVRVAYTPRRAGWRRHTVQLDAGPPLTFRQLVLP